MKLPIAQAVGRIIKCPECGKPAPVKQAQQRISPLAAQPTDIVSAASWYEVTCPYSGRKLYRATDVVELMPEVASHV